jgi:hypothetical protein
MDDTQLREYSRDEAGAICQSSEWEGIPLDKQRLEERTFEHYKALRDGE